MPLETATYIADLNSSNPAATDSPAQADDHLRLIKGALKAQFPNFTAAAVASTNAAIDAAVTATANGASVLADAGAFFKTNTTDGFTNPSAGEVDIKAGGSVIAKAKSDLSLAGQGAISAATTVTAGGAFVGGTGQLVPTGATMVWWNTVLPTGYLWVNGALVSRTTYAGLFAVFGTFYGAGDGSTTFALPDLRDNVPVGAGTMGATSAVGRITNWATGTLGALIGACTHALSIANLPAHDHGGGNHNHTFQLAQHAGNPAVAGGSGAFFSGYGTGTTDPSGATIASQGSNTAHNNVQNGIICNWIIKT